MATIVSYLYCFILFLLIFISHASVDRRFSDFKRCADDECSLLLCRGKASNDFSGPDCRFLSFKRGETIYVYYKLSGQRSDVWAGSVSSHFGYFPKDLLTINHIYTEREIEVPAEETDFVCFDTGLDQFVSYDIDTLLSYSETQAGSEDASVEPSEMEETPIVSEEVVSSQDQTLSESDHSDIVEEESEQSVDPEALPPGPSDAVLSDDVDLTNTSNEAPGEPEAVQDEKEGPKDNIEGHTESLIEADSSDKVTQLTLDTEFAEQIAKAKKELTGIVDSWATEHAHHSSDKEAKDGSPADPEVPSPGVPWDGDAEPFDDDLIFEEEIEPDFGEDVLDQFTEEAQSLQEEDEKTGPSQPNDAPSESSTESKVTEVKHDGKITEYIAKAKKELEGIIYSWSSEHIHQSTEDVQEPKDPSLVEADVPVPYALVDDEPLDNDLIFEEAGESIFGEGALYPQDDNSEEGEKTDSTQSPVQSSALESAAESESSDKIAELRHDGKTTEQIAKAKKEFIDIADSWATELVPHTSEDKEPEDLEEDQYHKELLEDENAKLSSLANTQKDEGEKGDLTPEPVATAAVPDVMLSSSPPNPVEPDTRTAGAGSVPGVPLQSPPSPVESDTKTPDGGAILDNVPPPCPVDSDSRTTDVPPTNEQSGSISDAENITDTTDTESSTTVPKEPKYSDSVLRLTLIRDHFKDQDMARFQKYLGLKHVLKIEAMFQDLEQELKSARLSQPDSSEDIERTLKAILEASETAILDEVEKMLDSREQRHSEEVDAGMFDEEAAMLDDFQELAFTLRQKYPAVSDSVPLVTKAQHEEEVDPREVVEDPVNNLTATEPDEPSDIREAEHQHISEPSSHSNLPHSPDLGIEKDGGHRNKDSQANPQEPEDIQRGPQAILDNPLDVDFGVPWEVEHPSSSSVDRHISDFPEDGTNTDASSTSVFTEVQSTLQFISQFWQYMGQYAEILVATLPEEWRPGPNFHGFPWEPVLVTMAVGILTFIIFFWRIILAVRGRRYQITEKQLVDRINRMFDEKSSTAIKISELQKQGEELEKRIKDSEQSQKSLLQENKELKKMLKEMNEKQKFLTDRIKTLENQHDAEQRKVQGLRDALSKSDHTVESLQHTITSYQKEVAKVQVLMDESKLREDVLKAEMLASEKENGKLKELKNSLQRDLKEWEAKHKDLNEKIKVFQKSQKELEDSLAHKENELDVMTNCIAELRSLETLETDKALSNGDDTPVTNTDTMKAHLKQMMDVSRVKATLSVIEDERNSFLAKLLDEQNIRQKLEEQIQKLEHDYSELESDKRQLENQHKTLEQKLEIMSEMYQQKENALHQKLTREELDRKEKESKLSEVDKKTLRAAEEVEVHKRRIQEMEEEMEKTERFNKNLIAQLEKKAHDNWLTARAAERALTEEKRESARLRQSLQALSSKSEEKYRHLPKPTPGHPDHPMRRGDSYGPSPVSGGAPSPPLMMEGPRRPPSAPLGRRSEPLGPRPPSEPQGHYADHGYRPPPRPDMYAPRTSSPTDGSQTAPASVDTEAEASAEAPEAISKAQGPGSLMVSPIRDSPGPGMPPRAHGPPLPSGRPPMGPAPPNGLPPPMIRPNGHPPMMPSGPMPHDPRFGLLPPVSEPHFGSPVYRPRPGPMPAHPFGPPPPFMRGHAPPLRDFPPMGPAYGPEYPFPPSLVAGDMAPPSAMALFPHSERDFRGPPPPLGYIPPETRSGQGNMHSDNSAMTDSSSPVHDP